MLPVEALIFPRTTVLLKVVSPFLLICQPVLFGTLQLEDCSVWAICSDPTASVMICAVSIESSSITALAIFNAVTAVGDPNGTNADLAVLVEPEAGVEPKGYLTA